MAEEILKLRKAAVDHIIERKLLVAEFKRLNLLLPQDYLESMLDDLAVNLNCKSRSELAARARALNTSLEELRNKAAERLMAEMVIGREIYSAGEPTPKEMNDYFNEHLDEFSLPERIRLALLLLPENEKQETIDTLSTQLTDAPEKFDELVKVFSRGPNRDKGGDVGFIERKNLRKEFAAVLTVEATENGKVYGPVKTSEGYYWLKVLAVTAGKTAVFAEHRNAIRQKLNEEIRSKAVSALVQRLREKASIRYYFEKSDEQEVAAVEKKEEKIISESKSSEDKETVKKMEKKTMVTLKTNHGDIKLELFADAAPKTVANFLEYVKSGFYNGTLFHRVIDNFMIQGGGFDQKFKQKATREPIENEADNGLSNEIGTIAMARTMDPHSATAQFFINVADNDFLDFRSPSPQYYGYCVFGKVVEGMDVVNKIKGVATGGRAGHHDCPEKMW